MTSCPKESFIRYKHCKYRSFITATGRKICQKRKEKRMLRFDQLLTFLYGMGESWGAGRKITWQARQNGLVEEKKPKKGALSVNNSFTIDPEFHIELSISFQCAEI